MNRRQVEVADMSQPEHASGDHPGEKDGREGGRMDQGLPTRHRLRPRPAAGHGRLEDSSGCEIEIIDDIAREAMDRDGGRSLTIRLAALDAATELASQLLADQSWAEAMSAWARVAFAAESLFGPDDASVLDAMRITASIMRRLDLSHDATHLLCEVAERTLRAEGPEAPRLQRVRAELEATLAA